MRVISGIYKRKHFEIPRSFKARPTTDFAKESLFNLLSNHIDFGEGIHALDLFGGTGSISLELLSRGCGKVICVEKDRVHHAFICKVMREVKTERCIVVRSDVYKFVKNCHAKFELIFADPPYDLEWLETLPSLIFGNGLLAPGGLFVLEHGKHNNFEQHPAFMQRRAYGSVNFSFFRQE